MKNKVFTGFIVFIFLAAILIFRPVPIVQEENALVVSGIVEKIKLTEGNDFVFKLKDNPTKYYINKGIEAGLDYNEFKQSVINKEVVVKYPKYWTPLDWNNSVRHISKVEHKGTVYFNKFANTKNN